MNTNWFDQNNGKQRRSATALLMLYALVGSGVCLLGLALAKVLS